MGLLIPMIIMAAMIISATKKMRKNWDEIAVESDIEGEEGMQNDSEDVTSNSTTKKKNPPPITAQTQQGGSDLITRGDITQQHPIIKDFDLRKAVIYSEIMTPKWREESK